MADLVSVVDRLARRMALDVGLEVVEVVVKGEGSRARVRVIVDRKGGVDLASCRTLSKSLSRQLDAEDPTPNRYTLEVTSPGTDRPLMTQGDFDRVEGRMVKATLWSGDDTPDHFTGTVTRADATQVVLTDSGGQARTVPYDQIITATQVTPW
ncbi:MAG: ribosome maturation factor RimP [Euzebya sp.]